MTRASASRCSRVPDVILMSQVGLTSSAGLEWMFAPRAVTDPTRCQSPAALNAICGAFPSHWRRYTLSAGLDVGLLQLGAKCTVLQVACDTPDTGHTAALLCASSGLHRCDRDLLYAFTACARKA
jgi:hypothetical protein